MPEKVSHCTEKGIGVGVKQHIGKKEMGQSACQQGCGN
jgi:hypothetical protein